MGGTLRAAAAFSFAVLALAPAAAAAPVLADKDTLEAKVVARINVVRKDHGLKPLRAAPRLAQAADRHAVSMGKAGYFSHDLYTPRRDPRWTGFGRWIREYWPGPGYSSWSAGENLAWGAPDITAVRTVASWMKSPGHRANILGKWRYVGVGAVHVRDPRSYFGRFDDVTIVAAEFGNRS